MKTILAIAVMMVAPPNEEAAILDALEPERIYVQKLLEAESIAAQKKLAPEPLPALNPGGDLRRMQVGSVGPLSQGHLCEIFQVAGPTSFILRNGGDAWVDRIDTSKFTDGGHIILREILWVKGTKSYGTAVGSSRTILHLVSVNDGLARTAMEQIRTIRSFRTWTDVTGNHTFPDARFESFDNNQVMLVKRDKKKVTLPMTSLSDADQKWIPDELRQRRLRSKAK